MDLFLSYNSRKTALIVVLFVWLLVVLILSYYAVHLHCFALPISIIHSMVSYMLIYKYQTLGIRESVHHLPPLLQVNSVVQSFVRGRSVRLIALTSASILSWSVTLWCSTQHKYQTLGIRESVHLLPPLLQVNSAVQSFVRGSMGGLSSPQTSSLNQHSLIAPMSALILSYNKTLTLHILNSIVLFHSYLTTASVEQGR